MNEQLEASAKILMRAHGERAYLIAVQRCADCVADHREDAAAVLIEVALMIDRLTSDHLEAAIVGQAVQSALLGHDVPDAGTAPV